MSIFSRKSKAPAEEHDYDSEEALALPTREDLDGDVIDDQQPMLSNTQSPKEVRTRRRPRDYSIEDAIELMNKLPQDHSDLVVSVVNTTLESTNVSVEDLIHQADLKEEEIQKENQRLEKEIQELQQHIAARNTSIENLMIELEQTKEVRTRLQLGLALNETPDEEPYQPVYNQGSKGITESRTHEHHTQTPEGSESEDLFNR